MMESPAAMAKFFRLNSPSETGWVSGHRSSEHSRIGLSLESSPAEASLGSAAEHKPQPDPFQLIRASLSVPWTTDHDATVISPFRSGDWSLRPICRTPPRRSPRGSWCPGCHLLDYIGDTRRNFGITVAIWVIVVHVIIRRCQTTQFETVKQLSAGLSYRASGPQSEFVWPIDLVLLRKVNERHVVGAIQPD